MIQYQKKNEIPLLHLILERLISLIHSGNQQFPNLPLTLEPIF